MPMASKTTVTRMKYTGALADAAGLVMVEYCPCRGQVRSACFGFCVNAALHLNSSFTQVAGMAEKVGQFDTQASLKGNLAARDMPTCEKRKGAL